MGNICVIGLGYVGLPLVINASLKGIYLNGYDVDSSKISSLNSGSCYIKDYVNSFKRLKLEKHTFSDKPTFLKECETIIICVPTPVNQDLKPDHSYVNSVIDTLIEMEHLPKLIVLESTVAPGYTRKNIVERLEAKFAKTCGHDFHVCFSPEREDPGNTEYTNIRIPKVLGGYTPACFNVCSEVYSSIFESIIKASSLETAELTKLHENTFRAVNIAYVNQLRDVSCDIGVDLKEVIDLASSKPFGFTRFEPSNGVGGHCIPVDPYFILDDFPSDSIVHNAMSYICELPGKTFDWIQEISNTNDKFIVVGLGYKSGVDDLRNSPNMQLLQLLADKFETFFYDPSIDNSVINGVESLDISDICFDEFKIVISNSAGEAIISSMGVDRYYDARYRREINSNSSN